MRETDGDGLELREEGRTADENANPAPAASESSRGEEGRGEPTRGDDEPRPMEVDNEAGEIETKESRKGIFPSPINGPEDDQIHVTATVRAVKGVANLIGYPALVKTARDWPVNEAVAALTDEERERTDRGHPPYHRMEYAHSEKPSSSSTALCRLDVTSRVDDMKFPERPEGIEDWQYAFTGKRGNLSRLADTRENYENEFRVQVERSGFGITTKDVHPYPATVFDNDRETKDKVAESLRLLATANGSFLLWGNRVRGEPRRAHG